MSKRALSALLWYSATWVGYEIVWSLTGVPRVAGPILAFAIAALVTIDPWALFWPRGQAASITSVPKSALEPQVAAPR
jgi:hypothetical protein